jgi:hypothetical protein
MARAWYVDEGLAQLISEWKTAHPGAVVGTIADANHSADPDVTQHAPDDGGPAAGDDLGEVDGGDFMIGRGVTEHDLAALFDGLVESRDPRILYVIHDRVIVSSVVEPWKRRAYRGKDPHTGHVHLSVNDKYDANRADWKWEARVERAQKNTKITSELPEALVLGDDDDMFTGYNHIGRAQALANWLDNTTADVDTDGVYGPLTAAKFGKALKVGRLNRLTTAQLKKFHGLV